MKKETHLARSIEQSGYDAAYDAGSKKLLSHSSGRLSEFDALWRQTRGVAQSLPT